MVPNIFEPTGPGLVPVPFYFNEWDLAIIFKKFNDRITSG
jgi:hypothetical protein